MYVFLFILIVWFIPYPFIRSVDFERLKIIHMLLHAHLYGIHIYIMYWTISLFVLILCQIPIHATQFYSRHGHFSFLILKMRKKPSSECYFAESHIVVACGIYCFYFASLLIPIQFSRYRFLFTCQIYSNERNEVKVKM